MSVYGSTVTRSDDVEEGVLVFAEERGGCEDGINVRVGFSGLVEFVRAECARVEFFVGRVVALLAADDVIFAIGGSEVVLVA